MKRVVAKWDWLSVSELKEFIDTIDNPDNTYLSFDSSGDILGISYAYYDDEPVYDVGTKTLVSHPGKKSYSNNPVKMQIIELGC